MKATSKDLGEGESRTIPSFGSADQIQFAPRDSQSRQYPTSQCSHLSQDSTFDAKVDIPAYQFETSVQADRILRENRKWALEAERTNQDKLAQEERRKTKHCRRGTPEKPAPNTGYFWQPDTIDDQISCIQLIRDLQDIIFWKFFDDHGDQRPDDDQGSGLYLVKGPLVKDGPVVVSLSVECVQPLLDDTSSPMERVLAIHTTAIVVSISPPLANNYSGANQVQDVESAHGGFSNKSEKVNK